MSAQFDSSGTTPVRDVAAERAAMAYCLGLLTAFVENLPDEQLEFKRLAHSMIQRAAPAAGVEISPSAFSAAAPAAAADPTPPSLRGTSYSSGMTIFPGSGVTVVPGSCQP